MRAAELEAFLGAHALVACAELVAAKGSSPREPGALMVIAPEAELGTIGGGALEHMVVAQARQALRDGTSVTLDIPLGPEIGQCCGGRVSVSLKRLTSHAASILKARLQAIEAAWPSVFIFGAGHVGKALARAMAPLPLKIACVDTRADSLPEAVVRAAPKGSSYVIVTHDHALDFLIAAEALQRGDAPYIGMVGSHTKRAKFARWFTEQGGDPGALQRLVLPIGALGLVDKRPEVIAALAAAEILVQIGRWGSLAAAVDDLEGRAANDR